MPSDECVCVYVTYVCVRVMPSDMYMCVCVCVLSCFEGLGTGRLVLINQIMTL